MPSTEGPLGMLSGTKADASQAHCLLMTSTWYLQHVSLTCWLEGPTTFQWTFLFNEERQVILEMKGIQEMKNTLLALPKNNSILQWEISSGSAWAMWWAGSAIVGFRTEGRVAVDASSKGKDEIQGSDYQMVWDTGMGCEEMYLEEVNL